MFKRIKDFCVLNCVVFTVMSLVLNLIYIITDVVKTSEQFGYVVITMQYLSVTTVMCFLLFLFDKIVSKDEMYSHIIALIIVIATVFGLGGYVYEWFPIFSGWSLATLGIIFLIYFLVRFIVFAKDIDASKQINKKLEEMQEEENE